MLDVNSNVAAWMIAGGFKSDAASDRNLAHLRALKASRSSSVSPFGRLTAAIAAIRPRTERVDPACCPA